MSMNSVLTGLLVEAIDNFQPKLWDKLQLSSAQLTAIRAGSVDFTDGQLHEISTTTGEPWWKLVLMLDKNNSAFTHATREICRDLESLRNSVVVGTRGKSKVAARPRTKLRRTKTARQLR